MEVCGWCHGILWPWTRVEIVTWPTGGQRALHRHCAEQYLTLETREGYE